MCAAPEKNVDIHLPGLHKQYVGIAGRHDRVSMDHAHAQLAMRDNFSERSGGANGRSLPWSILRVRVRRRSHLQWERFNVKVALDCVEFRSDAA